MGEEHKIMIADGRCWPECIFSFKIDEKKGIEKYLAESLTLFCASLVPHLC